VGAVIRVSRTVYKRDIATGLWDTSSEVAKPRDLRSPAILCANILRFNDVENVSDTRYRITLGGLDALRSLHFM
jgi:hypothetical protein